MKESAVKNRTRATGHIDGAVIGMQSATTHVSSSSLSLIVQRMDELVFNDCSRFVAFIKSIYFLRLLTYSSVAPSRRAGTAYPFQSSCGCTLSIAKPRPVGMYWLPPQVSSFTNEYPMSLPLNVSKIGDIVACCNENFFNAEIGPFCTREEKDGSMRLEEQLPN